MVNEGGGRHGVRVVCEQVCLRVVRTQFIATVGTIQHTPTHRYYPPLSSVRTHPIAPLSDEMYPSNFHVPRRRVLLSFWLAHVGTPFKALSVHVVSEGGSVSE